MDESSASNPPAGDSKQFHSSSPEINADDIDAAVRLFCLSQRHRFLLCLYSFLRIAQLEKNPLFLSDEKFSKLRKSAGHVLLSAYGDVYKRKDKSGIPSRKQQQKKFDKNLIRSRGMLQQRRDVAVKRGFQLLDDNNTETAVVTMSNTNLPPIALPPTVSKPVCSFFYSA